MSDLHRLLGTAESQSVPLPVLALGFGVALLLAAGLAADVLLLARFARQRLQMARREAALCLRPWAARPTAQILLLLILVNLTVVLVIQAVVQTSLADRAGFLSAAMLAQTLFFHGSGIAAVVYLLRSQKLSWHEAFGAPDCPPVRRFAQAVFCYLAAVPPVALAAAAQRAVLTALGQPVEPQAVISLLAGDDYPLWLQVYLGVAAVTLAPVVEEILFRGIALPLLGRYGGFGAAALAVSFAFASIHGHAPSAGPLFVMALSFAAAYAATGSLLVPIVMHALFNGSTLAVLLVLKTCSALQYIQ